MHPALVIALLAGLFLACGIVVTILAFRRAPDGFEDESGFHALPSEKKDESAVPAAVPSPEFRFGALHAGLSPVGGDLPHVREIVGR